MFQAWNDEPDDLLWAFMGKHSNIAALRLSAGRLDCNTSKVLNGCCDYNNDFSSRNEVIRHAKV